MDWVGGLERHQVHPPHLGRYLVRDQMQSPNFEVFPDFGFQISQRCRHYHPTHRKLGTRWADVGQRVPRRRRLPIRGRFEFFEAPALYPWPRDGLWMAEADKQPPWTSTDRPVVSADYPQEHCRVRRTNYKSEKSTKTLHREALTRELTFLVGFELEFTLLKGSKGSDVLADHGWSTSLHPGLAAEILVAMVTALERGGIAVHSFHPGAGPGQYKIVTGPLQPMQAADALSFSRDVIRGTASGHQCRATFAPWIYEHQCATCPLLCIPSADRLPHITRR